jgi:hypothetical protein
MRAVKGSVGHSSKGKYRELEDPRWTRAVEPTPAASLNAGAGEELSSTLVSPACLASRSLPLSDYCEGQNHAMIPLPLVRAVEGEEAEACDALRDGSWCLFFFGPCERRLGTGLWDRDHFRMLLNSDTNAILASDVHLTAKANSVLPWGMHCVKLDIELSCKSSGILAGALS